eukprot:15870858-Heterocapsa_arctica.AAC.1
MLKQWSSTQATVALSSAEAELISAVRGASEGMGIRNLAIDVGVHHVINLGADASAAIGDKVRSGESRLHKVLGLENPADLLTKYLAVDAIDSHSARLSSWLIDGRAESAPRLSVLHCERAKCRRIDLLYRDR